MKHCTKKTALLAGFVYCSCQSLFAQQSHSIMEWGIKLGSLVYQGDLAPGRFGSFKTQKLAIGFHAGQVFDPSFSWRASLWLGKLKGDESKFAVPDYHPQRNFYFTTPVTELSAQFVWNITRRNRTEKGFSPYLFAGAGFSLTKIKRDWSKINTTYFDAETSEIWAGLAADSAHTLPRILPVIPVGGGFNFFISRHWGLTAEATYRIVTTDYLDGFSQAANPAKKDNYFGYSAGITYRTGMKNRLGCPVLKY